VIAYFLAHRSAHLLDRAQALLGTLPAGTRTLGPGPAPSGWPSPWSSVDAAGLERWIADHEPETVVVDGAPAPALVVAESPARLAVVAAPGGGEDGLLGAVYGDADLIIAPWPETEANVWPDAWRARTLHLGAVGWRAALETSIRKGRAPRKPRRCVVLTGTGGGPGPRERRDLLTETHGWQWTYAAEHDLLEGGPLWDDLADAAVVIGAPSEPLFATLTAVRRPAVLVLPERPTSCQRVLARIAESTAPVVVVQGWPEPARWSGLLDVAQVLDGRAWATWDSTDGLRELAARLDGSGSDRGESPALTPV